VNSDRQIDRPKLVVLCIVVEPWDAEEEKLKEIKEACRGKKELNR
jgi:hypothetical protein